MSSADTHLNTAKEWIYEHRGPILAVFAIIAAVLLLLALTLSWFLTNSELSTVGKVDAPADLKILGPNETATEQLDLTYDADSDVTTKEGRVYRRRAFCVESGKSDDGKKKAFELQVANTTNINGLEVHVYRVKVNGKDEPGDVVGYNGLNEKYSWLKLENGEVTGFTNIDPSQAKSGTFGGYDKVQSNAQPVYRWKQFSVDDLNRTDIKDPADATNFIIEYSWPKSENSKESDVAYLIAKSASAQ